MSDTMINIIKYTSRVVLITLNFAIFILILSCKMDRDEQNDVKETVKNNTYFYDFNLEIKLYHSSFGILEEISYKKYLDSSIDKRFRIKHIKYFDNKKNTKFKEPEIRNFYVNKTKIDTIFSKVIIKIIPVYTTNQSNTKVPPPPITDNEWEYCTIELDFVYGGDKYLITSNNTDIFYDLLNIL
jgi:hypothetical protein